MHWILSSNATVSLWKLSTTTLRLILTNCLIINTHLSQTGSSPYLFLWACVFQIWIHISLGTHNFISGAVKIKVIFFYCNVYLAEDLITGMQPKILFCLKHGYVKEKDLKKNTHTKDFPLGVPGWLSRLSVRLGLWSWSRGSWIWAPRRAWCRQLRAWSLLWILCLPLFLPLPCSLSLKNK